MWVHLSCFKYTSVTMYRFSSPYFLPAAPSSGPTIVAPSLQKSILLFKAQKHFFSALFPNIFLFSLSYSALRSTQNNLAWLMHLHTYVFSRILPIWLHPLFLKNRLTSEVHICVMSKTLITKIISPDNTMYTERILWVLLQHIKP